MVGMHSCVRAHNTWRRRPVHSRWVGWMMSMMAHNRVVKPVVVRVSMPKKREVSCDRELLAWAHVRRRHLVKVDLLDRYWIFSLTLLHE